MRRSLRPAVLPLIAVAALLVLLVPSSAVADAPPGPYFNGFETGTSSWFDLTNGGTGSIARHVNGYTNSGYASGIASATGGWHARLSGSPCDTPPSQDCEGPFTRWGGYNQTFPIGGYRTQIDIYLDTTWAASHRDARFDFSSAIARSSGWPSIYCIA